MHILYVSHLFPPEIAAAAARVSELSQQWVARGHAVTVLTGYPNHPTGRVPPPYQGVYWWQLRHEWQQGVRVIRVPLLPAANRGTLRRSCAFASFGLSAAAVAPWLRRADVVIATSPQPLTLLAGLTRQRVRATPLIVELRDLWPEQLAGVGYADHAPPVRLLRALVRRCYARARHIVTVSPAFAPVLQRDYGVSPSKISLIPNGVDLEFFTPSAPSSRLLFNFTTDQFVVGFVGTLGLSQRFEPVLAAAAALQPSHPEIQFLLIGDGANRERIETASAALRLRNLHVYGLQPRQQMPGILAGLDLALVLLEDNPYFRVALPSKMFELMAMERPIALMAEGVAQDVLTQARAGVSVRDATELADVILRFQSSPALRRTLGVQGRQFVTAHYNRAQLAAQYIQLLEGMVGGGSRADSALATSTAGSI